MICSQHGKSRLGSGLGSGIISSDAEGGDPQSNIKVRRAGKAEILKCHDLGRGDLEGWHVLGGTISVHSLLEHPSF
jgi:hypothetical protein